MLVVSDHEIIAGIESDVAPLQAVVRIHNGRVALGFRVFNHNSETLLTIGREPSDDFRSLQVPILFHIRAQDCPLAPE